MSWSLTPFHSEALSRLRQHPRAVRVVLAAAPSESSPSTSRITADGGILILVCAPSKACLQLPAGEGPEPWSESESHPALPPSLPRKARQGPAQTTVVFGERTFLGILLACLRLTSWNSGSREWLSPSHFLQKPQGPKGRSRAPRGGVFAAFSKGDLANWPVTEAGARFQLPLNRLWPNLWRNPRPAVAVGMGQEKGRLSFPVAILDYKSRSALQLPLGCASEDTQSGQLATAVSERQRVWRRRRGHFGPELLGQDLTSGPCLWAESNLAAGLCRQPSRWAQSAVVNNWSWPLRFQ